MYVMVRHAHAGDKKLWTGNDRDRPLSPVGYDQAEHLADVLSGLAVRTLWSSPTVRCRQTLAPLAAALGVPVADHPLLAPDTSIVALHQFVSDTDFDGVLLCTHGEVFDALTERVRAHGLLEAPPPGRTAKGSAWVIDADATASRHWSYLPPVPPVDSDPMDTAPTVLRDLTPADNEPRGAGAVVRVGAFAGTELLGAGWYTVTESESVPRADCSVRASEMAQYHGVGTALFRRLTETARDRGLAVAGARVPAADRGTIESLVALGWSRTAEAADHVEMTVSLTGRSVCGSADARTDVR